MWLKEKACYSTFETFNDFFSTIEGKLNCPIRNFEVKGDPMVVMDQEAALQKAVKRNFSKNGMEVVIIYCVLHMKVSTVPVI